MLYPEYKSNSLAIAESTYRKLGPYGDWLASLNDKNTNFANIMGYYLLDQTMKKLFSAKCDGMRSAKFFLDIATIMISFDPRFGKDGEFELTETLKFKAKLEEILACLPDDAKWYSASWKQPEAAKKFYAQLQEYIFKENPSPFSLDMRRLEEANQGAELVPIGVAIYDDSKASSLEYISDNWPRCFGEFETILRRERQSSWSLVRLSSTKNLFRRRTEGSLFIADHEQKKSVKIGMYSVDDDGKFRWSGTDDFNNSMPKSMYVVMVKK